MLKFIVLNPLTCIHYCKVLYNLWWNRSLWVFWSWDLPCLWKNSFWSPTAKLQSSSLSANELLLFWSWLMKLSSCIWLQILSCLKKEKIQICHSRRNLPWKTKISGLIPRTKNDYHLSILWLLQHLLVL